MKHSRLVIDNTDYEADQLIQLGALQQQIEYGDTPGDLSLDLNLAPIELNGRVIYEHRLLRGKSQRDAIDEFLTVATRLQNYGIELHDKMQLNGNHAEVMRSTNIFGDFFIRQDF